MSHDPSGYAIDTKIPCKLAFGLDGRLYAVFSNQYMAELYKGVFTEHGCAISCFGNYDNAYRFPIDADKKKE